MKCAGPYKPVSL
jgi:hypothetical protein